MEYAQFDPIGFALLWEKVIKQYIGQTTNEERVKELMTQFSTKFDGYEAILRKQKYLAGDVRVSFETCAKRNRRSDELFVQAVTLADLLHVPLGNVVFEQFELGDLERRPNLGRQACFRVWTFRTSNTLIADGGKTSHPDPRGRQ